MKIRSHKDLDVYQAAFALALELHQETKSFPPEGRYSLTDQIRRSSRSVCANIAEALRKRRYPKSFIPNRLDFMLKIVFTGLHEIVLLVTEGIIVKTLGINRL